MAHKQPPHRIPPFTPVPVRKRCDGWTPLKQAEFIGVLAETGSVSAAAKFVGMARETAYRLRRKPGAEEFAAAWDAALAVAGVRRPALAHGSRKVTHKEPWRTILDGRWRVVMRRGKYCGAVREASNSALLGWLAQLDRSQKAGRKAMRNSLKSRAKTGRLRVKPVGTAN